MDEKITYLDGLRGIAAVNVMIMHFFVVLTPAMVYSNQTPSHFGNFESVFSSTPLGLIGAGNFSVCIFFVLSGFVLTQKYFRTAESSIIISGAVRRYLRLAVPVLGAVILSFLLSSAGLFRYYAETVLVTSGNNPANYWMSYWTFTPDIIDAVKQALWESFFTGSDLYYNPVLWTMTIEFYGSMLVFAMSLLFGLRRNRWTFYLAAAVVFFNSYYLAFLIGMALADVSTNKMPGLNTGNKKILLTLLCVGLFLGSYPVSNPIVNSSLYAFLNNGLFKNPKMIYHILGAGMIMYVLLHSERLQKVFSSPVPAFLGKISYSLYLVHFLVISSLTCALFLALYPIMPYGAAVIAACLLSLLLIIPVSYLFYKYIDKAGVVLSKYFYYRFFSPCVIACAGYLKQQGILSPIFGIYEKIFK